MRPQIFFLAILVTTLACSLPVGTDENIVRTQVAIELTQTAIAQPAPAIKITPPTVAATAQVPAAPTATVAPPTLAATPAATIANNALGSISGALSYPASGIPPLEVYAINKEDAKKFYSVKTNTNQTSYTLANVPIGEYYVLAYYVINNNTLAGGYTKAVPCGLTAACTDHTLIAVSVKANAETRNVDVKDWYAPPQTFPAKPK